MLEGLTSLIRRAKSEGGKCYASLYELTDHELIGLLAGLDKIEIVLSNNGTGDKGEPYDKGNMAAAQALQARGRTGSSGSRSRKRDALTGCANEPTDQWQDRYFDPASMASLERQFWVSEGAPLPARTPKTAITKRLGAILAPGADEPATPAPAKGKGAAKTGGTKTAGKKAAAATAGKGATKTTKHAAAAKTKTSTKRKAASGSGQVRQESGQDKSGQAQAGQKSAAKKMSQATAKKTTGGKKRATARSK